MNQHVVSVDHQPGVVFTKFQAETGITYLAIEPSEVVAPAKGLLVRHGSPETGQCGYYPLYLLLSPEPVRQIKAEALGKRPPSVDWVNRTRKVLADAGVPCMQ